MIKQLVVVLYAAACFAADYSSDGDSYDASDSDGFDDVAPQEIVHSEDTLEHIIREVNNLNTTWTADYNQFTFMPSHERRRMFGLGFVGQKGVLPTYQPRQLFAAPESFDARQKWPNCNTINDVRNQAACGACWAFASAEAISDANCIANNENVRISAEDAMSCVPGEQGCNGGWPSKVWSYWVGNGLVTDDCRPYTGGTGRSPVCDRRCKNGKDYNKEKRMGAQAFRVIGEAGMQDALQKYGPLSVTFEVFEDFMQYKTGVYTHRAGKHVGYHAVKMIGWGKENGSPYWLCVNSWTTGWGEKGQFRIRRGANECGIEKGEISGGVARKRVNVYENSDLMNGSDNGFVFSVSASLNMTNFL